MATAPELKAPTLEDVPQQLETPNADLAALTQTLGEVGKGRFRQTADDMCARADGCPLC